MKSKSVSGGPSSRGNVTHGLRSREVGEMKFRVEGGKLIGATQFCKEMNAAIEGFWSRRPHILRSRGGYRCQFGKQDDSE